MMLAVGVKINADEYIWRGAWLIMTRFARMKRFASPRKLVIERVFAPYHTGKLRQ